MSAASVWSPGDSMSACQAAQAGVELCLCRFHNPQEKKLVLSSDEEESFTFRPATFVLLILAQEESIWLHVLAKTMCKPPSRSGPPCSTDPKWADVL